MLEPKELRVLLLVGIRPPEAIEETIDLVREALRRYRSSHNAANWVRSMLQAPLRLTLYCVVRPMHA